MINQEEYEILKKCDDEFKWVARDKNRKLWAYTKKPDKGVHSWGRVVNVDFLPRHSKDLFQFIQWEDEEPHEIAGLIREYEIKELRLAPSGTVIVDSFSESEETEMKKDIEWVKKEIKELMTEESQNYPHDEMIEKEIVLGILNQLGEPEVPVVPEDVYEHIKMNKVGGVPLDIALDGAIGKLEILGRDGIQFHEFRNNQDSYARAWLAYPDIEVEKEPLYYVVKDGVVILSKRYRDYDSHKSHWIGTVTNKEYIKENLDKVRFTEQEIKDFDGRFWSFAVPVEEVEELWNKY